jgi:hypothetical protein
MYWSLEGFSPPTIPHGPLLRCFCFDLGNHTSAPSREDLGLKVGGAVERQNKKEMSRKKTIEKRGLAGNESSEEGNNGKRRGRNRTKCERQQKWAEKRCTKRAREKDSPE